MQLDHSKSKKLTDPEVQLSRPQFLVQVKSKNLSTIHANKTIYFFNWLVLHVPHCTNRIATLKATYK